MKIVNWNVEWATPRTKRSVEILDRISRHAPEIVCLTETHHRLLRDGARRVRSWPPNACEWMAERLVGSGLVRMSKVEVGKQETLPRPRLSDP